MAEFSKVMRQAKRMCASYGVECGPCALHERYGLCPLCAQTDDHIPADWKLDKMLVVERIVMDWAAANPEPRYPTWEEWQKAMFPRADGTICTRIFGVKPQKGCAYTVCTDCRKELIPADIAEKLGIKPMGGDEV